uniref:FtsX-like permease family protein n=1 Tax=Allorhizocola rhizosphaerae TaxID=1872709 RepID=UPI0013C2A78C
MRALARMRANIGHLTLVAVLTLIAGALLVGAPRVANRLEDEALRARIESLPFQVKDVTFHFGPAGPGGLGPQHAAARLEQQLRALDPAFADRVGMSWYAVSTNRVAANDTGLPARALFGLREGTGIREGMRLTAGRWPDNSLTAGLASARGGHTAFWPTANGGRPKRDARGQEEPPRLEVALTAASARVLNQAVGSDFTLGLLPVRVVGIVEPTDPRAPVWEPEPLALKAYAPQNDGESFLAYYLTDVAGMSRAHQAGIPVSFEWRYRIGLSRLDAVAVPSLIKAVLDGRRAGIDESSAETGLDTALARFADNAKAAQSLFAIVQAATLATVGGLILLASKLAVNRRRQELDLLRARGASLRRVGRHTLVEVLPIVPVAAALGWCLGTLAPGRPAATVLALVATPVIAMSSFRRPMRTVLWEIGLVLLAVLGVWLLRRRGLDQLDFYLVCVPVLLAAAAAIVTLRALPLPLGLARRMAARGRGAVGFLGLTGAGRRTALGPIAVLVVAVCTAVFSIGVAGTVANGRTLAAGHDIPADAVVKGFYFAPDTAEAIGALPGVTGVARYAAISARDIISSRGPGAERLGQVFVFVVDTRALTKVASGKTVIPQTDGALVSTQVALDLGAHKRAVVDLQGRDYDFDVVGVVDAFPGIPRTATRFVVLPWDDKPLNPNGFFVSGAIDPGTLIAAGNAGQARWGVKEPVTEVHTWAQRRSELERTGVNGVLTFSYGMGALAGVVLALLAVGFAVLAGARARGKVLSRLRTMGLAAGQGRRLLLVELAPVVSAAVVAGGAVG